MRHACVQNACWPKLWEWNKEHGFMWTLRWGKKGIFPQARYRYRSLYWSLFASIYWDSFSRHTRLASANTCAKRLILGIWYRNIDWHYDWPLRLLRIDHYDLAGLEALLGVAGALSTTVVAEGASLSRFETVSFATVVALESCFSSTSSFFRDLSDSFPKLIFPNAWLRSPSKSTLSLITLARSLMTDSVVRVCVVLVEPGEPGFGDRKGICGLAAA